jgi:hypothetical protein
MGGNFTKCEFKNKKDCHNIPILLKKIHQISQKKKRKGILFIYLFIYLFLFWGGLHLDSNFNLVTFLKLVHSRLMRLIEASRLV